jgi:pimeloyl-ACP methyl ester carboxylesterase
LTQATSSSRQSPSRLALAALLSILQGCTHLAIEDCGGDVLGENQPRIRSSHFRMFLADLPAASNRFAPYAVMSTLAYAEDAQCGSGEPKVTPAERPAFEALLFKAGWKEVRDPQWAQPCEDNTGMFFRVWTREADTREVVIAFRGTWGMKDWLYGNLHWVTRFLPMEDQFSEARKAARKVLDRFSAQGEKPTRFYTTGHSLGGGLAQHILYTYPQQVTQAVAFDPSSVTGFADQTPANQAAGCDCSSNALGGEPRIYRVYDAYEVLANLRIFHKTFLPPERHIQEVRFPNAASHSMKGLAEYFVRHAASTAQYSIPWFAGKGNFAPGESCTAAFSARQKQSCEVKVRDDQWNKCPQ